MPQSVPPLIEAQHDQIFPVLAPAEIERLARFGERRAYAAGERIVTTGEIAPGVFIILTGRVDVSQRGLGHAEPGRILETIRCRSHRSGAEVKRVIRHLFLFIGAEPHAGWLSGSGVTLDDNGFVSAGGNIHSPLETTLPGVFAIDDVRSGSVKRVAAAVGEGAQVVAALHAFPAEAGDKPAHSITIGRP